MHKEHRQKTSAVVNYILKNLGGDLSLEKLASVANYSPFHFQKVFTDIVGLSPKQYVIKTRLETACHFLIIQPGKPVLDIALDCGFSSPAVFSRAFRAYFGTTAEHLRMLPQDERAALLHANGRFLSPRHHHAWYAADTGPLDIVIKRLPPLSGVCINTTWEEASIKRALHDIMTQAAAHDLLTPASKIIGIASPHHDMYRAFVSVSPGTRLPPGLNHLELKGGKFAAFKTTGNMQQIFGKVASWFFKTWLPASGYRLADVQGYEHFLQSPMLYDYSTAEREFCIPIEPAG